MPLWVWMVLLAALIKLPIAGLLLWIPFRYDESMQAPEEAQDSSEEDGGSRPSRPVRRIPHPRGPCPTAAAGRTATRRPAPRRVRTTVTSTRRVGVAH